MAYGGWLPSLSNIDGSCAICCKTRKPANMYTQERAFFFAALYSIMPPMTAMIRE